MSRERTLDCCWQLIKTSDSGRVSDRDTYINTDYFTGDF